MKTSIIPFYILSIIALIITLVIGITHGHIGLTLFAITPYMMLFFLLNISKHNTAVLTAKVLTVFLVSVGLYFLLDTTYMERKLGDKFSFLFMPIWQWTMLLVSGFVIYLSNGKKVDNGGDYGT
ncbi:hypothetical protein C9926_02080 [Sulfurovum lithotrophicum]|nr:hypothetical protein C9926_02080 [Sulfurovum lithotrophicum]